MSDRQNERETRKQNEEALRETRRQLDPDAAAIADNAKGAEALSKPASPGGPHCGPERPADRD